MYKNFMKFGLFVIFFAMACSLGVPQAREEAVATTAEDEAQTIETAQWATATSLRATEIRATEYAEMTTTAEWATATALHATDFAQLTAEADLATPGPSPTPALVSKILFPPGATDVGVRGAIGPNVVHEYTLRAMQGQAVQIYLNPFEDLTLEVLGRDGTVLQSADAGFGTFIGHFPSTQEYILHISGAPELMDYSFSVRIPARILQESGASSATVSGSLAPEGDTRFVMYSILGEEGQTMTVTVSSPNNNVYLSISGFEDGQPYLRNVAGQTSHSMTLPVTQDYLIGVLNAAASNNTYTITVEFTD